MGDKEEPHARVRWGETGMVTLRAMPCAGVRVKLLSVGDHDIRRAPLIWGIALLD